MQIHQEDGALQPDSQYCKLPRSRRFDPPLFSATSDCETKSDDIFIIDSISDNSSLYWPEL